MLVPAEKLAAASFKKPQSNSLHLSTERKPTLFWLVDAEEATAAIFLSGPYVRHAFYIEEGAPWAGVSIGPLDVRIDPSSATPNEESAPWLLKAADDALSILAFMKVQGFDQPVYLPICTFKTLDHFNVYFSRWAIGTEIDGRWSELVSFTDGEVGGDLLPQTT